MRFFLPMFSTWCVAAWLPTWLILMMEMGVGSDSRQFGVWQAAAMTLVTLGSPALLALFARAFVRRAPERHWSKRATMIVCLLGVLSLPWAAINLIALWFWNV